MIKQLVMVTVFLLFAVAVSASEIDNESLNDQDESITLWDKYSFNRNLNIYILSKIGTAITVNNSSSFNDNVNLSSGGTFGVNFYKYFGFELNVDYQTTGQLTPLNNISPSYISEQYQLKPIFIFQIPFWKTNAITLTPYIGVGASATFINTYESRIYAVDNFLGPIVYNRFSKSGPTEVIFSPVAKLGFRAGIYWLIVGAYAEYIYAYNKSDISTVSANFEIGARF